MEKYKVAVMNLYTSDTIWLEIQADENETTETIVLSISINHHKITAEDENYLPAFQKLRDALLLLGYGMQCNGSRINAVQSGMMGATEMVYFCGIRKAGTAQGHGKSV